jgi:hypothetical protein
MKISVGISLTVIIVLILASTVVFLLFTGHFDGGKFEVIQTSWASSKLVVMVARRSDHEALSGDQYFVLVGDHPSAHELRYAYYHHGLIFRSDGACVTASWEDARNLVVSCHDGSIEAGAIAVEQRKKAGVGVSYVNIPLIPERE